MTGASRPWSPGAQGVLLDVRLTPKGGRDAIDGIATLADGRCVLKVRVRAAAQDNAANTALVRLIAAALGMPARAVTLVSGMTSRVKRVAIAGDAVSVAAALEKSALGTK